MVTSRKFDAPPQIPSGTSDPVGSWAPGALFFRSDLGRVRVYTAASGWINVDQWLSLMPTPMVHGNSLATGGGSTTPDASYPDYLGALMKAPVIDMAVGGSNACWGETGFWGDPSNPGSIGHATGDGGWVRVMQDIVPYRPLAPYLPHPRLNILQYGGNDLGWSKSLGLFLQTMRSMIARTQASKIIEADAPIVISTGATTANSQTVTSSVAAWTSADVNKTIVGTNIVPGATIITFTSSTSIQISIPATATGSSLVLGWSSVGTSSSTGVASIATTNASNVITSNGGDTWYISDVGKTIAGAGIPTNTIIAGWINTVQVRISQNATATATATQAIWGSVYHTTNWTQTVSSLGNSGSTFLQAPASGANQVTIDIPPDLPPGSLPSQSVTYRGANTLNATASLTTIAPTIHSATLDGDYAIAVVTGNTGATGSTISAPAGWFTLATNNESTNPTYIFGRHMATTDASTTATFTFSVAATNRTASITSFNPGGAWLTVLGMGTYDAIKGLLNSHTSPKFTSEQACLEVQIVVSATSTTLGSPASVTKQANSSSESTASTIALAISSGLVSPQVLGGDTWLTSAECSTIIFTLGVIPVGPTPHVVDVQMLVQPGSQQAFTIQPQATALDDSSASWQLPGRSVGDAVTNATTTVTSATAQFHTSDVGRAVTGSNIPTAGGPIFRDHSEGGVNSTSILQTLPLLTADGDFLLAFMSTSGASPGVIGPGGWTKLRGDDMLGAGHAEIWYKFWHTGDATTATWSWTGTLKTVTSILAYSGVNSASIFDNSSTAPFIESQTVAAHQSPAITTTGAMTKIVRCVTDKSTTATTVGLSSGVTQRGSIFSGGGGSMDIVTFDEDALTAGTYPARTATFDITSSNAIGYVVSLNGLPNQTTIASVTNATTAVLSQTATASGTGYLHIAPLPAPASTAGITVIGPRTSATGFPQYPSDAALRNYRTNFVGAPPVSQVPTSYRIFNLPPSRQVYAGVTSASATLTSTVGAVFSSADVGRAVYGPGIAPNTIISAFTNNKTVTLSAAATATFAGQVYTIGTIIQLATTAVTNSTMPTPTVVRNNTSGATTYTYVLEAVSLGGTGAQAAAALTTGNVSPDNTVNWTPVTGAQSYRIYRNGSLLTTGASRSIPDVGTTNGSTAAASLSGQFSTADIGQIISGPDIPNKTFIVSVTSPQQAIMSQAANATGTNASTVAVVSLSPSTVSFRDSNVASFTTAGAPANATMPPAGVAFDCVTIEALPAPVTLVGNLFKFLYPSTYQSYTPPYPTDADVDNWNTGLATMLTAGEWPTSVALFSTDVIDKDPLLFGPDTLHPNDRGHAKVAQSIAAAMAVRPEFASTETLMLQSREARWGERVVTWQAWPQIGTGSFAASDTVFQPMFYNSRLNANDGTTTNGSTTITNATAFFNSADIGKPITGSGLPPGLTLAAVASGTSATLSGPASATSGGAATFSTTGIPIAASIIAAPGDLIEAELTSIWSIGYPSGALDLGVVVSNLGTSQPTVTSWFSAPGVPGLGYQQNSNGIINYAKIYNGAGSLNTALANMYFPISGRVTRQMTSADIVNGRATIALFGKSVLVATASSSVTTTNGSTQVTAVTNPTVSWVGRPILGTGIAAGATITQVTTTGAAGVMQMSMPATAAGTVTATIGNTLRAASILVQASQVTLVNRGNPSAQQAG